MNNTNICPLIISPNIKFNEINNSINYYHNETYIHVKKFLATAIKNAKPNKKISKFRTKEIIQYVLSNDDMFNNIVTAIMLADSTWDKNKSSLQYWRNKNCMWTLNTTFRKNKKRLYNYGILKNASLPLDILIEKEENQILQSKIDALDKRSKKIIELYYKENIPEKKIAKIFSITQQRVSKIILKATKNLKDV